MENVSFCCIIAVKGESVVVENSMNGKKKEKQAIKAMIENYKGKQKNKFMNSLAFILPFSATFFALRFCLMSIVTPYATKSTIKENTLISYGVAILMGVITVLYVQYVYDLKIRRYELELIFCDIEDAKENVDEDIYQNLIKISYKYLDEYYLQTRQQAQNGFWVTMSVSIMGAAIIAIGIGAMFLGKATPAYVTTASGVITEFIAAVFFYLYNKTIVSMSDYHNKLVLSQNISIALKVADTLPDSDKTKAKNTIIDELLKDVNSYLTKSDTENKK